MAQPECPKCGHGVSVQQVRSDGHWIRHYECVQCGYKWIEITDYGEGDDVRDV